MSEVKKGASQRKRRAPATTPEARENQLVSLAVDLVEKQLIDGTATSQVITHYLKLSSTKDRLEKEKLKQEVKLLQAKTENIESVARIEELYSNAIKAMQTYRGDDEQHEE